jgi:chaperone required for assembly of F1-ATPase
MTTAVSRRFYKSVSVRPEGEGFAVFLDERQLKTPAKRPLVLPTAALAEAIAEEWAGQGDAIKPLTMPLTRLTYTALDRLAEDPSKAIDEAAAYGGTDLVCYRASHPAPLVRRQAEGWQPLLEWLSRRYDVALAVTSGIMAIRQSDEALVRLKAVVAARDPLRLAALHALTTASGSLVIALAVAEGEIDAGQAFDLSHIDETVQAEQWGEDAEAAAAREAVRQDILASGRFLALLG